MAKRSFDTRRFEYSVAAEGLPGEYTHLDVSVTFSKGGANYFLGTTDPKGYEISVRPVKVELAYPGATYSSKSFMMFDDTGVRVRVLAAARYNRKVLEGLNARLEPVVPSIVAGYLEGSKEGAARAIRVEFPHPGAAPATSPKAKPVPGPKHMVLLPKEVRESIPAFPADGTTESEPVARVKFFTPWSNWSWFATEAEAVLTDGSTVPLSEIEEADSSHIKFRTKDGRTVEDITFFGMVHGFEEELGYFSFSELTALRGTFGLRVERDMHFRPRPVKDLTRAA